MMRSLRYDLSGLRDDLDKCTLHLTEAILLPPLSVDECGLSSVPLLIQLALALLQRSKQFEQTRAGDVFYSIQYLHYLQALPLDSSGVLRSDVTGLLVEALGLQFGLGTQDTTRNVEEMVVHCRELLASDVSTDFPITAFCPGLLLSTLKSFEDVISSRWTTPLNAYDKQSSCAHHIHTEPTSRLPSHLKFASPRLI